MLGSTLSKKARFTACLCLICALLFPNVAKAQGTVEVSTFDQLVAALQDASKTDVKISIAQDITRSAVDPELITVPQGNKVELTGPGKVNGLADSPAKIVFSGSEVNFHNLDLTGVRTNFVSGSKVTMDSVSYHDNDFTNVPVIYVEDSELTVSSFNFKNNTTHTDSNSLTYAPIALASSKLSVLSGDFSNNYHNGFTNGASNTTFGGVIFAQLSELEINNANFTNNKADGESYGGAILGYMSNIVIKGSNFSNNSAYKGGAIGGYRAGGLHIDGATFDGNQALNARLGTTAESNAKGGAIFLMNNALNEAGKAMLSGSRFVKNDDFVNEIHAATFANNHSDEYGGAVYVEGDASEETEAGRAELENLGMASSRSKLHIYNTLVTNNSATNKLLSSYHTMGGGLYFCPDGKSEINLSEGIALINNTAETVSDKLAAGADFTTGSNAGASFMASNTMLGGAQNVFYIDGSQGASTSVSASTPRFDPANPGTPLPNMTKITLEKNLSLINKPSDDALTLARRMARVTFENNSALWGGALAVNGELIVGTEDLPYTVNVRATFYDGVDPQDIEGAVTVGGTAAQPFKLTQANNYALEGFATIPDPKTLVDKDGNLLEVFAEAYNLAGYEVKIEKLQDDAARTISFVLHISKKSDTLDTPDKPDKTDKTDKTDTPEVKPEAPKPAVEKKVLPKTSDIVSFGALAVCVGAGAMLLALSQRLKKKH